MPEGTKAKGCIKLRRCSKFRTYYKVQFLQNEVLMPLFEVAILQKPTKKEVEDGSGTEKLLFGPQAVVAKDETGAAIAAARTGVPAEMDMGRVEVLVRPFG
jgi:hypothetical protein